MNVGVDEETKNKMYSVLIQNNVFFIFTVNIYVVWVCEVDWE